MQRIQRFGKAKEKTFSATDAKIRDRQNGNAVRGSYFAIIVNIRHSRQQGTTSMQLMPFLEQTATQASQENLSPSCKPEMHYHVHESPPMDSTLIEMNPNHTLTTHFCKIQFNIILALTPRLVRVSSFLVMYAFLRSLMRAACSTHIIYLDLIKLIIYGEHNSYAPYVILYILPFIQIFSVFSSF
jgi:hypothetical protein